MPVPAIFYTYRCELPVKSINQVGRFYHMNDVEVPHRRDRRIKSSGVSPALGDHAIFRKIQQDTCFINQHIDNKMQFYCKKIGDSPNLLHFTSRHTKLRLSDKISCVQATNIERTMTTFWIQSGKTQKACANSA